MRRSDSPTDIAGLRWNLFRNHYVDMPGAAGHDLRFDIATLPALAATQTPCRKLTFIDASVLAEAFPQLFCNSFFEYQ
jgi:hypothetical protein